MTDSIKNALLVASSLTALALGGAALAGAASGDESQSGSSTSTAAAQTDRAPFAAGPRGQRPDEDLLSGDTASKVRAAALARVAGGTIERVETDADGHAEYEAHMLDADGNRLTVYVNADFDVVSVESGP
jgi:uncharacterized membrane protein YkoI